MERRKFSREIKFEVVKLVRDRGMTAAQASCSLDVHANVLRKWVREAESDPVHAFPGHRQMRPVQLGVATLQGGRQAQGGA